MLDGIVLLGQVVVGGIAFLTILILAILGLIEVYDRITGADAKRQAQLDRLRQLEEEGEDY